MCTRTRKEVKEGVFSLFYTFRPGTELKRKTTFVNPVNCIHHKLNKLIYNESTPEFHQTVSH